MLSAPSSRKIYLYHYLTFGFYFFYWCSRSRADINRSAHQQLIPSTWLLALPGGNYWWMWQYSHALEHVSYRRIKAADTFLLYIIVAHAWLLLSFGFQPNFGINWGSHASLPTIAIVLLLVYFAFCALLQITGVAFFCAVTQSKINHARQAAQTLVTQ